MTNPEISEIVKEIKPAVEEVCIYLAGRLKGAIRDFQVYREQGEREYGRKVMNERFRSLPEDLTKLLQQPNFPRAINDADFEELTEEELERKRLERSYFLAFVSDNVACLAEMAEQEHGPCDFAVLLRKLSIKIAVDPKQMFPDMSSVGK